MEKMKIMRFNFKEWDRKAVPRSLQNIRPKGGKFFAVSRNWEIDPRGQYWWYDLQGLLLEQPIEAYDPEEFFKKYQDCEIWAANAYIADQIVQAENPEPSLLRDYQASLKRVRSIPDIPPYEYKEVNYCPCGCGMADGESSYSAVELIVVKQNKIRR